MGPLLNDPVLLGGVVAGLVFLVGLKVVAFVVVRRVMRRPPQGTPRPECVEN